VEAVVVLADPGTSVLVTYMSAQEQSRQLERMASRDFIVIKFVIRGGRLHDVPRGIIFR
jgi:hypothetical protein